MRHRGQDDKVGIPAVLCGLVLLVTIAPAVMASDGGAWLADVQRQIAEQEYHVSWQGTTYLPDLDASWQAPNRAHGFRTYFTDDGVRLIPRTAEATWEWTLSLVGYGRGPDVRAVQTATLAAVGNRIDFRRDGITEWYVNDRRGLKQSFSIDAAPERTGMRIPDGAPAGARLSGNEAYLVLVLTGTLSPLVRSDGQSISWSDATQGSVLHYGNLLVHDARGRELSAWMETFSDAGAEGIRLVFDDRGALYPVTVDPLVTSPSWSQDGENGGDEFGHSVAGVGDVNGDGYGDAVVGAYRFDTGLLNAGKVYGYYGSPSGLATAPDWTQTGIQTDDWFGYSVAAAGDVNRDGVGDVIVGAPGRDGVHLDEGRALVYHGSSPLGLGIASWQNAGPAQAGAYFGFCVGTAGDVDRDGDSDVIVSAVGYDDGAENDAGLVRVYYGSGSGVSDTPAWTTTGGLAGAEYGQGCGTAGDVNGDGYADVIVGADKYPSGGLIESGRAFVYHGSGSGLHSMADWTMDGQAIGDLFGRRVATIGDVNGDGYADVAISAPYRDGSGSDRGRVYVYLGGPSGLLSFPADGHHGEQDHSHFGESLGPAGDVNGDGYADFIVGAPGQDDVGKAYLYLGGDGGPGQTAAWSTLGEGAGALYGASVATAGDVDGDGYSDLIVGAPGTSVSALANTGRAYLFLGGVSGPIDTPGGVYGNEVGEALGYSVGNAGDVNGDGYGDIIVSGPYYDGGLVDLGIVVILQGTSRGYDLGPYIEGTQSGALMGFAVDGAGDVDNDGYDDVIVGAPLFDGAGGTDSGRVYVFNGSSSGVLSAPSWTTDGSHAGQQYGYSVARAGDVNGDGFGEVIVGALRYSNGESNEGAAFVYNGSALGLSASPSWTAEGNQTDARFGVSVAGAGDVNRDGYSDVIVGADAYDGIAADSGSARVYLGASTGLRSLPSWYGPGTQAGGEYGHRVASAGDVNGDGFSDIVVGATRDGQSWEGRAYVYHGGMSSVGGPYWTFEPDQDNAFLGAAVAGAGDVNGDGYADVIVAADRHDNTQLDEGRAWVFLGSMSGLSPIPSWFVDGLQSGAQLGYSVAGGVDLNGDGFSDPIIGAPAWDDDLGPSTFPDVGIVYVYWGNFRGNELRPRQRRTLTPGPVAHLGATDETDRVRVGLLGKTPFGRGRIKYEWEVKMLGDFLDGDQTELSPNWLDSGVTGYNGEMSASSLREGWPYHWRVRVHYDPVSVPWQSYGRWLTVPRNGIEEADLRTGCGSTAPTGGTNLTLSKTGDVRLTWDPVAGATRYDIVSGPILFLRDTFGNFRLASTRCLGNDIGDTTTTDPQIPPVADGYWYLVRGVSCSGVATYDSGAPSQQGNRDSEINDANAACP